MSGRHAACRCSCCGPVSAATQPSSLKPLGPQPLLYLSHNHLPGPMHTNCEASSYHFAVIGPYCTAHWFVQQHASCDPSHEVSDHWPGRPMQQKKRQQLPELKPTQSMQLYFNQHSTYVQMEDLCRFPFIDSKRREHKATGWYLPTLSCST